MYVLSSRQKKKEKREMPSIQGKVGHLHVALIESVRRARIDLLFVVQKGTAKDCKIHSTIIFPSLPSASFFYLYKSSEW